MPTEIAVSLIALIGTLITAVIAYMAKAEKKYQELCTQQAVTNTMLNSISEKVNKVVTAVDGVPELREQVKYLSKRMDNIEKEVSK